MIYPLVRDAAQNCHSVVINRGSSNLLENRSPYLCKLASGCASIQNYSSCLETILRSPRLN